MLSRPRRTGWGSGCYLGSCFKAHVLCPPCHCAPCQGLIPGSSPETVAWSRLNFIEIKLFQLGKTPRNFPQLFYLLPWFILILYTHYRLLFMSP